MNFFIVIGGFIAAKVSKNHLCADMEKKNWLPLIIRSLTGTIAFFLVTVAVKNIPLTLCQILFNTLPFMIAILLFIWLRERITKCDFVAMCFCFGGIMIVAFYPPEAKEPEDKEPEETLKE